jgi:hypothetical protein
MKRVDICLSRPLSIGVSARANLQKQFERFGTHIYLSIHHDQNYQYSFSCGCDADRVQRLRRRQGLLRQGRVEHGKNGMR